MASIILCLTQHEVTKPYTFKKTGQKVYSLEQALYHTYKNWQNSDFLSEEFIDWVSKTLNLPNIALSLKNITTLDSYSKKVISFLSITDYIDPIKLATTKIEIEVWEQGDVSEFLKQEGDLYVNSRPILAQDLYKKALAKYENAATYNNLAISYMNSHMYKEAAHNFNLAYSLDKNNIDIILNYSLALIEINDLEKAFKYIRKAESFGENSQVYFLYGKISYKNKHTSQAVEYLKNAISINPKNEYYYTLSKIYVTARRYDDAKESLENILYKDSDYYINFAEICASCEDYPNAIKAILKSHELGYKNTITLTFLASYYRQNYDLDSATNVIHQVLQEDETNKLALLEQAKIKKANGKLRDYQKIMQNILVEVKENYRNENINKFTTKTD